MFLWPSGAPEAEAEDKPSFETLLQLAAEEMPSEVGLPLVAPWPVREGAGSIVNTQASE